MPMESKYFTIKETGSNDHPRLEAHPDPKCEADDVDKAEPELKREHLGETECAFIYLEPERVGVGEQLEAGKCGPG